MVDHAEVGRKVCVPVWQAIFFILLRHITCIGERGEIPIAEGGVWIGNEVETNDVACNNLLPSLFPNL